MSKSSFSAISSKWIYSLQENLLPKCSFNQSWHGCTCSRAHGHQQWVGGVTEFASSAALDQIQCFLHLNQDEFQTSYILDAPTQENTCLCRHSCLQLISNHKLHTPWREKHKRPSVRQKRLLFKLLRILAVVLVEVSANLCGESESGRHGQSDGGHFSEICTFSSKEILHLCPTVGLKTSTRLAAKLQKSLSRKWASKTRNLELG